MDNRIFVGNLPWSVGYEKLKELFSPYGEIEDAIVMSDRKTGRSRGFGFVTFKDSSSVDRAIAEMNQKNIEGRELKVTKAEPRKEKDDSEDLSKKQSETLKKEENSTNNNQ